MGERRTALVLTFILALLLFSAVAGTIFVKLAEANFFPIPIPQPAELERSTLLQITLLVLPLRLNVTTLYLMGEATLSKEMETLLDFSLKTETA